MLHRNPVMSRGQWSPHPSLGVFSIPACMAKSGGTTRLGIEDDPILGILWSNSPIIHPIDHMSTALVYPPRDMTTCHSTWFDHVVEVITSIWMSTLTDWLPSKRSIDRCNACCHLKEILQLSFLDVKMDNTAHLLGSCSDVLHVEMSLRAL